MEKVFEAFVNLDSGGPLIWVAVVDGVTNRFRRIAWSTERNDWAVRWEGDGWDAAERVARRTVLRILRLRKMGVTI